MRHGYIQGNVFYFFKCTVGLKYTDMHPYMDIHPDITKCISMTDLGFNIKQVNSL